MDLTILGSFLVPNLRPWPAPVVVRRSVHNLENQPGTQPIRVLQHNLTYHFENTNAGFAFLTKQAMAHLGYSPGISYHVADKALFERDSNHQAHMPYLLGGKVIHIHETFLSYVWCICYALVTTYEERVVKPDMNRTAGSQVVKPNLVWVRQAERLMAYAQSLVYHFTPWDKTLPNPEVFDFYNEEWIYKINGVFVYAMTFILQHEFGHVQRSHAAYQEQAEKTGISKAQAEALSRQFEREADMLAIQALKQGHSTKLIDGHYIRTQISSELGTLIGLCCLLFLGKSVNFSTTHPSIAERIDSFLRTTTPPPTSGLWGIASVALQMWAQQHGHNLPLPPMLGTYKDLYTVMLGEAKKLP